ncbi:MAG: N-acetylmuramoyl-L-alanine amidase [Gammaproteobacteria bacterium]|jgi:N-acetylmuramoyl-L-alanine amidase
MRGIVFLLSICFGSSALSAEIKSVRMSHDTQRTAVVFDLSEPLRYRISKFRHPDRLVIDFQHVDAPQDLVLPKISEAPVLGLRYARRGGSDLRIVLDLSKPLTHKDLLIAARNEYGDRLVLNLAPAAGPTIASPVVSKSKPAPVRTSPVTKPALVASTAAKKSSPSQKPFVYNRSGGDRDIVIAIDAGHGGQDVGAIGPGGSYEKDLALAVSRKLVKRINSEKGMRGVLVRDGDRYLALRERMDVARDAKADLFISVHADAFRDPRVKGSSVYVLSQRGASSEAALWLAENENASDLIGGVRLHDKDDVLKSVLLDLSQTASLDASIDAANAVLRALKQIGPVHKNEVQHAGFMVLKSPDIPSLLVETAFISNPAEENRLRTKGYQQRLAESIFSGIRAYFGENTPLAERYARLRQHRVSDGDSLSMIANRYDVSMESIKFANNLATDGVQLGTVLKIP